MIDEMNGINESDTWHDAIAVFTEVSASSTEATRPNIFRIAGFPRRETVSSNVLAYFFDPAEGHGLKDLMLKGFAADNPQGRHGCQRCQCVHGSVYRQE